MRPLNLTLLLVLSATCAPLQAQAQHILYSTGFEAPDFRTGSVNGQGAFVSDAIQNTEQSVITSNAALSGGQSLEVDGSSLLPRNIGTSSVAIYDTAVAPRFNFNPVAEGLPIVEVQADMQFEPGSPSEGEAGIALNEADGTYLGEFYLTSRGFYRATSADGIYRVETGFDPTLKNTFGIRMDYANGYMSLMANHRVLGFLGFSPKQPVTFGRASLFFESFQPTNAKVRFDNYSITASPAVPEPGSMALLLTGLPVVVMRRRKR